MNFARWQLTESPFARLRDERAFYDSPAHEEALARLYFLIEERRPLGLLTGLPGTGKSLLLQILERQIRRSARDVCRIDLAGRSGEELLCTLESHIGSWGSRGASPAERWLNVQSHLQSLRFVRRQLVVLFDHCDSALPDGWAMLERVAAVGEAACGALTVVAAWSSLPENPAQRRLRDRCALLIPVLPLKRRETSYLIFQTLEKAGCECDVFTPQAIDAIHELSGGIPGRSLRLCDLALIAASESAEDLIGADVIRQAADELVPAACSP